MNIAMAAISQIMLSPLPGLPGDYELESLQIPEGSDRPARAGVEPAAVCRARILLDSFLLGAGVPCGGVPRFVV